MQSLSDFLLQRIAEDEAAARFPRPEVASQSAGILAGEAQSVRLAHPPQPGYAGALEDGARVLARWDPSRVLAECEAKRAQIAHLIDFMEGDYAPWNEDQLRIMAAVYADHEDYDEAWKP